MNRIFDFLKVVISNIKLTITRFTVVIISLGFITAINSIIIENGMPTQEQLLTRMIFSGIIATFLGVVMKFLLERFQHLTKYKFILEISTLFISIMYFFLLTTNDKYSQAMFIRLFVCSFALFATYLYLPSAKNSLDFGKVALVHFKSAFTAILYGIVLYLGLIAIYFAIDFLLFKLNNDIPVHLANIVFVFLTPVYYLSLLPKFNSTIKLDIKKTEEVSTYPRVLEILVSYIIIPLITVYSLVLVIYFIKILVTSNWPVGQVGPMVLSYSAVGLLIYILSSNLENKSTLIYRKYFTFILIPLVIMQLISSYIRINAYGITESRYYVVLFGIFSITTSLYLIISKKKNSNMIVLLAACFAILSIIPPVDAFNISFKSQSSRLESILLKNNMLNNNKLELNANISNEDKHELTDITNYMKNMGYLRKLDWIPEIYYEDNIYYTSFDKIYGFPPYYNNYSSEEDLKYTYAMLDTNNPIDIEGFDKFFKINIYNDINSIEEQIATFTQGKNQYTMKQKGDGKGELLFTILDENNNLIMEISMKDLFDKIEGKTYEPKNIMSQEDLSLYSKNEILKVKIILESISIDKNNGNNVFINGSAYVFVATP